MSTTIDPHTWHVTGSIAKTAIAAVALVTCGWMLKGAVGSYEAQLKSVTDTMVTKADLDAVKKSCTAQCKAEVLASIAKDGFACYSTPLRGENFRRCDLRSINP